MIISYQLDNQGFFGDDRETYFHGSNLTRIYIYIYNVIYFLIRIKKQRRDNKMGLFNLFGLLGGSKTVELDKVKSDENKKRMREIFDTKVDNGSEYKIVYAYSEDIGGANFAVLRTVSYKYRSFILGYKENDLSVVFLEVSPDLNQVGEALVYRPQDVKKTNFIKMVGSYYLQYGSSFKKEFFNFFVPETIDEIVNHDWYDEDTFTYIDQRDEHSGWVDFWNKFCR